MNRGGVGLADPTGPSSASRCHPTICVPPAAPAAEPPRWTRDRPAPSLAGDGQHALEARRELADPIAVVGLDHYCAAPQRVVDDSSVEYFYRLTHNGPSGFATGKRTP